MGSLARAAGIQGWRHGSGQGRRARRRRYLGDGALGEGSGQGDLQGRLRFPSPRGVVRQHPRDARDHAATRKCRQQPRRGPHRGADPRHRTAAGRVPPTAADPPGRGGRHPRAGGLAHRLWPGPGPTGRVLSWFPDQNTAVTSAITKLPDTAWTAALAADGEVRDSADVAELTGLLDLSRWPAGMRVIVRRERPHPGAQLSLFEEHDGYRYQAFATNTGRGQLAFLRPGTEPTPASRTASKPRKTPAWDGYPHASTPSTRHGYRSPPSPPTSPAGFNCSPSTVTSQRPSPRCCASACCTYPLGWPAADGDDASNSRGTGHGRPRSATRSTAS